jgi:hypothetical protein
MVAANPLDVRNPVRCPVRTVDEFNVRNVCYLKGKLPVDIPRYIGGLAVLLVATLFPLLSAHLIMLRISSQRGRRRQQVETAAAE